VRRVAGENSLFRPFAAMIGRHDRGMPWTLTHAVAVVPLQRWSRGRLSFPGLVAGCRRR